MNTTISKILNRNNEEVGSISFESNAHAWCISSEDPASCKGGFQTQREAFDFWHSHYDVETGRLKAPIEQ